MYIFITLQLSGSLCSNMKICIYYFFAFPLLFMYYLKINKLLFHKNEVYTTIESFAALVLGSLNNFSVNIIYLLLGFP